VSELIDWLRGQLDEDERIAAQAAPLADSERWTASARNGWDEIRDGRHRRVAEAHNDGRTHIARHDPARVLAEVEAKRRIVDYFAEDAAIAWSPKAQSLSREEWYLVSAARDTIKMLALPYADQPGYLEEWRP